MEQRVWDSLHVQKENNYCSLLELDGDEYRTVFNKKHKFCVKCNMQNMLGFF